MTRNTSPRSLLLWGIAALSVGLASCSCEGSTVGQQPKMRASLSHDPTGEASFLLDFGEVVVGTSKELSVHLENVGNTLLALEAGAPEAPFSLSKSRALRIDVGGQDALGFRFEPGEEGEFSAIVELKSNERGGDRLRTLRLLGGAVEPRLRCTPSPLDLGRVRLSTTKAAEVRCVNELEIPLELRVVGFWGNDAQAFSVQVPGAEDGRVTLAPGAELSLPIVFRAASRGSNDATLLIEGSSGDTVAELGAHAEVVESDLLLPAACLDFGYVNLGERETRSLRIENVGDGPLIVRRLRLSEEDLTHFSVEADLPLELAAGEIGALEVTFHPQETGQRRAELAVVFDADGQTDTASGCLGGFGGGPLLVCREGPIDFGRVAVGFPVQLAFSCTNEGSAPEDGVVDPLMIDSILSTLDPPFEVEIRNEDESLGAKSRGYSIGESFQVQVRYGPRGEGFDAAEIVIESEAAPGGALHKPVSGEGVQLPPCEYAVVPPQLGFGIVAPGQEVRQSFGIRNELGTSCLISDLRLSDASSEAFEVDAIANYELRGFETLEIPVRFAPSRAGAQFNGEVQFQISSDEEARPSVPLRGASKDTCLTLEPNPLDFGKAAPGCSARQASLVIRNGCSTGVTLVATEINPSLGGDVFQVIGRPPAGTVIAPQRQERITLSFGPEEFGEAIAAVAVEVEAGEGVERYMGQLLGEGASDEFQTDVFNHVDRPKVDILWILDNSASMAPYQQTLRDNLSPFLAFANSQGVDYQIGVTTTGLDAVAGSCPGGVNGGEDGRLFPVDGILHGHPRILTGDTPDLDLAWGRNVRVGTCHNREYVFEAAKRALSPELLSASRSPLHNSSYDDGNLGFLRADAALSIIYVTDEREQSSDLSGWLPNQYLDYFRSIKGHHRPDQLRIHGITGPRRTSPDSCRAEDGDPMIDLIEETDGTWLSICTPINSEDWETGLRQMSTGAFGFQSAFRLRGTPTKRSGPGAATEADIEVAIDGRVAPHKVGGAEAWTYNPLTNSVEFSPFFVPERGAQIQVTYKLSC